MKRRKPEWVKITTLFTCSINLERGGNNTKAVGGKGGRNARYCFFISTPNEAQHNCCCARNGEVPLHFGLRCLSVVGIR